MLQILLNCVHSITKYSFLSTVININENYCMKWWTPKMRFVCENYFYIAFICCIWNQQIGKDMNMDTNQPVSFLTFYAQYFRKKKHNILIGSILTSLLLIFVKTSSKAKYIQDDLISNYITGRYLSNSSIAHKVNVQDIPLWFVIQIINLISYWNISEPDVEIEFKLEHCNCNRKIKIKKRVSNSESNELLVGHKGAKGKPCTIY